MGKHCFIMFYYLLFIAILNMNAFNLILSHVLVNICISICTLMVRIGEGIVPSLTKISLLQTKILNCYATNK